MICTVTNFHKVERENAMPYYILKAKGVQGNAAANAVENGMLNPFACQSRVFNFTKCLFPGTDEQCQQIEDAYQCDDDGNVLNEDAPKIALISYEWQTPCPFHIIDGTGAYLTEEKTTTVTKVAPRNMTVNGKAIRQGQSYQEEVTEDVPRVFNRIIITLFADAEDNCAEGNPEEIAKRNWSAGLANGRYEKVEGEGK